MEQDSAGQKSSEHPFGEFVAPGADDAPKKFKGLGAAAQAARYVPKIWGLDALYNAPAAVCGASRLPDILADAAEIEPDGLESLALRLRAASPQVMAGENWMDSSLRVLSAVCMCLAKAGRHRAFGSVDYRPEWSCEAQGPVSKTYESSISDPCHDSGWCFVGAMEMPRVAPRWETPLSRSATVEEWMEWRGFQYLARAGIPGSGADWAIECARKLDLASFGMVERRKFVEACHAEHADREARVLAKAAREPDKIEGLESRRGPRI